MWWPQDKRADETKEGLGMHEQKQQTLTPSLPHAVTVPGAHNLPPLRPQTPDGGGIRSTLAPSSMHASSSQQWPARPLCHSLYPGYKSGLRTPVQRRFCLELARCSDSVSHSNKLHLPLTLSLVWKCFSNLHPDQNGGQFWEVTRKHTVKGKVCYGDLSLCLKNVSLAGGLLQAKNNEGLKASEETWTFPLTA